MIFDRYAGMASAVGIVLILTMIAWLGLWGPVKLEAIKDWQTFIAAMIALAAAAVAWNTAMAKLRFDQSVQETAERRKRLAALFRADLAVKELREKLSWIESNFEEFRKRPFIGMRLTPEQIRIVEPPEFDAIWDNLDSFPRDIIRRLATIRYQVRAFNASISGMESDLRFELLVTKGMGPDVTKLVQECIAATEALKPLIETHA